MLNSLHVKFVPKNKDIEIVIPAPKPSSKYLPDWFKDMPHSLSNLDNTKMDETAKKCMPFLDSLTSGYTQELSCDVEIINSGVDENGNDLISYNWAGPFKPLSTRLEDTRSRNVFPSFNGYYNKEIHWNSFWEPKTPKGYSTFYYHPANRLDLPFTTLNAIIDTDNWFLTGPVPFMIRRGFEGIIPAGTPIYQMIFIKRDSWKSSMVQYDDIKQKQLKYTARRFFKDGYKKQHWSRKDFS
jgi:hypothetical protein